MLAAEHERTLHPVERLREVAALDVSLGAGIEHHRERFRIGFGGAGTLQKRDRLLHLRGEIRSCAHNGGNTERTDSRSRQAAGRVIMPVSCPVHRQKQVPPRPRPPEPGFPNKRRNGITDAVFSFCQRHRPSGPQAALPMKTIIPLLAPPRLHRLGDAAPSRPNLLFLLSDDHSYPYLSTYGDPNVRRRCSTNSRPRDEVPPLLHRGPAVRTFPRLLHDRPLRRRRAHDPILRAVAEGRDHPARTAPRQGRYHTGICGRSFHLDGATKIGAGRRARLREHALKTFADRVDFLNTCPDPEVRRTGREVSRRASGDKPFFLWRISAIPTMRGTPPPNSDPIPRA